MRVGHLRPIRKNLISRVLVYTSISIVFLSNITIGPISLHVVSLLVIISISVRPLFSARNVAERGTAMASCPSVSPYVCLSVTLRYRGYIGWNSAKIISRLISLTFSLSADPNMTDLLQRERIPDIMPRDKMPQC